MRALLDVIHRLAGADRKRWSTAQGVVTRAWPDERYNVERDMWSVRQLALISNPWSWYAPGPSAPEAPVTSEEADSRYYTLRVANQPDTELTAL